jgi:hypothetical protein
MEPRISKEQCTHKKWSYANKVSTTDGLAECRGCGLLMAHSSALQLQNLRYQKTFQKWFNIITIAIALLALGVSIFK